MAQVARPMPDPAYPAGEEAASCRASGSRRRPYQTLRPGTGLKRAMSSAMAGT